MDHFDVGFHWGHPDGCGAWALLCADNPDVSPTPRIEVHPGKGQPAHEDYTAIHRAARAQFAHFDGRVPLIAALFPALCAHERRHLSRADLVDLLGVTETTLSRWLHGARQLTQATQDEISLRFGLALHQRAGHWWVTL